MSLNAPHPPYLRIPLVSFSIVFHALQRAGVNPRHLRFASRISEIPKGQRIINWSYAPKEKIFHIITVEE